MSKLTSFNVHRAFQFDNDQGTILQCRGGIFNYYEPKTVKAIKNFIATDYPLTDAQRKTFTQNKDTIVLDNLDKTVLDKIVDTYNQMLSHQGGAQVCFERERTKFKKIAFVTERWSD
jgi:hypothetical protein